MAHNSTLSAATCALAGRARTKECGRILEGQEWTKSQEGYPKRQAGGILQGQDGDPNIALASVSEIEESACYQG